MDLSGCRPMGKGGKELLITTGFVGKKRPFRRFPVDMSGFAFSVGLLHLKKPEMPYKATFEEEGFLLSMKLR